MSRATAAAPAPTTPPAPGFEGSYLGALDKISPAAILECKICWTPYDPAVGDEHRQIDPGTSFADLPGDWSCPNCGAPKEQFMVLEDPGAEASEAAAELHQLSADLVTEFREIWHSKMRDVPMVNKRLHVEAVGFQIHEGRPLGVLISPWFMNLIQFPGADEDWSGLIPGAKELLQFPSGDYEFIHNHRPLIGGYKACSLFSPMGEFATQIQAREVARAVMLALFDPENRCESDRAADIRAAREADLAAQAEIEAEMAAEIDTDAPAPLPDSPSRRAVITGGLGGDAPADGDV